MRPPLSERAARHAALGDPVRLSIVDDLARSDRSPVELGRRFDVESNLLAHHLDVLEGAGLIGRSRSSGDGRRRYVHLRRDALDDLGPEPLEAPEAVLFVCSQNSARSQLAAATWARLVGTAATSAGTHPAPRVHPGAAAAADRAGLDLTGARPRSLDEVRIPALVVTVCDRAHEELSGHPEWLHWSIPDPVPDGAPDAFDAVVVELGERIGSLVGERGAA